MCCLVCPLVGVLRATVVRRSSLCADREFIMCDNRLKPALHSSFREAVLAHLLLGDLLSHFCVTGTHAELLKPSMDDAGYDMLIEANGNIRQIQCKVS